MDENVKLVEQEADSAHPDNSRQEAREAHLETRQESLAVRLRHGDRSAAAELVDAYYEKIYLFLRRIGHNHQLSEDLTQETFMRAWDHIGQLRDGKALNAWLYRIAGNVSRLHWRRRKGRQLSGVEGFEAHGAGEAESDRAGHREELSQLREAVGRLPWKLRQAIVLHYMEHLTISRAAEAAGVREGTFKSRLNRALNTLRKQFA
ncbi:MAG: RNA polymerase sigma factor [Phycisphaerales bacterium]|nr:MAG: RNA polymerase sigma factor [Phycisphaerales bacterium]